MDELYPAQADTPPYPVPVFLPRTLQLEGALDVYEPARGVFARLMKFLSIRDFRDRTPEEIHGFLLKQILAMVCPSLLSATLLPAEPSHLRKPKWNSWRSSAGAH